MKKIHAPRDWGDHRQGVKGPFPNGDQLSPKPPALSFRLYSAGASANIPVKFRERSLLGCGWNSAPSGLPGTFVEKM